MPAEPLRISAIVVAMNEERDIGDCIRSVAGWTHEVVVMDSGSRDRTVALCRELGATVVETDWPGDGPQKQRALDRVTGDWVICLDADERVTPALRDELLAALPAATHDAFSTPRRSTFCGYEVRQSGWWPDRIVRIFRRGRAQFTPVRTHTRLIVAGTTGSFEHPIYHLAIDSAEEMIEKMNVYSTEGAHTLLARGVRGGFGKAVLHGLWAFVRTWVLRRGFVDGRYGFTIALFNAGQAYYKYFKLGELQRRK